MRGDTGSLGPIQFRFALSGSIAIEDMSHDDVCQVFCIWRSEVCKGQYEEQLTGPWKPMTLYEAVKSRRSARLCNQL